MLLKIATLKDLIESNGIRYDSESLYSCFQGHASPVEFMKDAGAFAASTCRTQPITNLNPDPICSRLRRLFEEYLITRYYSGNPALKRAAKIAFNRFFAKISGVEDWKNSKPNWRKSTFEIFTTNFDNLIELYSKEANVTVEKGYRIGKHGRVIFTPEDFDTSRAPIKLSKLHGSVELSLLKNGDIMWTDPPAIPGKPRGKNSIAAKVMVYGIRKNLLAEPYFELLFRLKQRLNKFKECIVVGYAFGDPWITQIFNDVVNRNQSELKITYIDKSPEAKLVEKPFLKPVTSSIPTSVQKFMKVPIWRPMKN